MNLDDAIRGRRSIRRFKPDPVLDAHIKKMVYAASLAPNGGNYQPWHFLAVTSKECRDEMARLVHDEGVAFFRSISERVPLRAIVASLVFSTAPLVFCALMKH